MVQCSLHLSLKRGLNSKREESAAGNRRLDVNPAMKYVWILLLPYKWVRCYVVCLRITCSYAISVRIGLQFAEAEGTTFLP